MYPIYLKDYDGIRRYPYFYKEVYFYSTMSYASVKRLVEAFDWSMLGVLVEIVEVFRRDDRGGCYVLIVGKDVGAVSSVYNLFLAIWGFGVSQRAALYGRVRQAIDGGMLP